MLGINSEIMKSQSESSSKITEDTGYIKPFYFCLQRGALALHLEIGNIAVWCMTADTKLKNYSFTEGTFDSKLRRSSWTRKQVDIYIKEIRSVTERVEMSQMYIIRSCKSGDKEGFKKYRFEISLPITSIR